MLEKSHSVEQLEQVRVCAEIGIECTNINPADRPDTQNIINRLHLTETMYGYIKTGVVTSQQAKHAPNGQHQGMNNSLGETSSKETATEVTVGGTNPCNSIWENTTNLDKLNETMHSLNPDIRRCFEFCSIFPRGSKLRRDDLVRLWIAQGFVKTSCAIEDMEDIAVGYIQDLVSISFLQPIGTSSDCFTIHDVLHDILDKVAGNCFRIDNARSHSGDGWEGDVPRHIQHLLIHHYDGEFITETIIGLENLRTLIVCVVGKHTRIEEEVIESICKRLPKLRVLAVAFSQEHDPIEGTSFSFPESLSQLKYLRYLAFRTVMFYHIVLPSALNKLQHIQLLDFGDGFMLEYTFAKLVNLRHIFCECVKLPYVGRLSSLQSLPGFTVSNQQGCELKQLRDLNKLQGKLDILDLKNVKSKEEALEASPDAKERLAELLLNWGYGDDTRCSPEVEADVLEGVCPPVCLQTLRIWNYKGSRYPNWMAGKQNGGPEDLQELEFWVCSQPGPACELAKAFPHLRVPRILECSWDTLPGNMEHLTSLKKLEIISCENIRSLPTLPEYLEEFHLYHCNVELMESCRTVGDPNWEKIEHIPRKEIL